MFTLSWPQLLLVIAIVLIVFGEGRLRDVAERREERPHGPAGGGTARESRPERTTETPGPLE